MRNVKQIQYYSNLTNYQNASAAEACLPTFWLQSWKSLAHHSQLTNAAHAPRQFVAKPARSSFRPEKCVNAFLLVHRGDYFCQ
jgi:hypothetical protein